ncbi:MAG TPA: FecR domain-containing protein [Burkholderiales bacterium]|nr:FecR domain-containing protein [Burkholderiales bacterium]
MKRLARHALLFLLGLLLVPALAAGAPSTIGKVSQLSGGGSAQAPGTAERKLATGDPVYAGERIRTGEGTILQIEFTDRSRFTLGPNAEFEVERYGHGSGKAEEESFHSRIFKGAFRFVSGLIARTQRKDMRVSVSVATIGIRGTHVEGEVSARREENGKTVDASARVALLEPEQAGEANAIVVENKFGSVVVDQPGYGTEIPDEKSPPSPVRRMQLRTIDNVMRAVRSSGRPGGAARPGRF